MHLEMDLEAALPQTKSGTSCPRDKATDNSVLRAIVFASKTLSSVERRYSNIEREALGILYRLKKFYHYCFPREVSIITDHKPLAAIFRMLQCCPTEYKEFFSEYTNQYRVRIIYKPGPDCSSQAWLSRKNHMENKNTEISGT